MAPSVHFMARPYSALPILALLLVATVAPTVPALAQPADLSGFAFLRLEPSARAAALGGSFSAIYGDDVNGLFYNPALLNETTHGVLSVSYLNHLSDINAGFVAYSRDIPGLASFGAGLRFMSWGELERADEQGNRDGTFNASDVALTVGAARAYGERLRYGVNLHMVYSSVSSYNASALAADIGVLYRFPDQGFAVSGSLHNAGVTLSSLGPTRDELPIDVRLSATKQLRHVPLLFSVTGYNLHDLGGAPDGTTALGGIFHHLTFGGEFQFSEAFNLRFGYNHRRHEALRQDNRLDLAGVGVGFGLKIARFRLDYAFNSWSFAGLHQFTVRTVL